MHAQGFIIGFAISTLLLEISGDNSELSYDQRDLGGDGLLRRIAHHESYKAFVYEPRVKPSNHPKGGLWPLLISLHGGGESGNDLNKIISKNADGPMLNLSKGDCIQEFQERFVVVAPQAPREDKGFKKAKILRFLDFLLDPSKSGLHLDSHRLYITGSSMGGFGALNAATTRRFAAAVSVAVAGRFVPKDLRNVPVWAFHGKNDKVMPHKFSKDLIEGLWALGISEEKARLTLYDRAPPPPGAPSQTGHGSALLAYKTPELFDWLLRHSKTPQAEL